MSVYAGPKIVDNGLVFTYDMSNTEKSWRGAPTTNLLTSPLDFSSGSWFKNAATVIINSVMAPDNTMTGTTVTATTNDPYIFQSISVTAGVSYTGSLSIKGSANTIGKKGIVWWWIAGTATGTNTFSQVFTLTSEWQRITTPAFVPTGSGTVLYRIDPAEQGQTPPSAIGDVYYIWGAQAEAAAVASPFVNGTRTNTQALLDLTNNNTITTNSLTYDSIGDFSFNGSGNNVSIPSINFSQEQTIEIWLQPLENDGNRRNPYNQAYGGYGTWTHEINGSIVYYYGDAGINANPYIGHTSGFTVAQNEIACVCTTRNTTTSWWYKNGIQYNSFSHTYLDLTTDTNPILIGTGYAGSYLGKIFAVKLYNRALSAAEVQQNFNAVRGRYGL